MIFMRIYPFSYASLIGTNPTPVIKQDVLGSAKTIPVLSLTLGVSGDATCAEEDVCGAEGCDVGCDVGCCEEVSWGSGSVSEVVVSSDAICSMIMVSITEDVSLFVELEAANQSRWVITVIRIAAHNTAAVIVIRVDVTILVFFFMFFLLEIFFVYNWNVKPNVRQWI